MGFLTGAFLKSYTARMHAQLQNKLAHITMEMERVTKQSGDMEKNITKMKQMAINGATAQSQMNTSIWMQQNPLASGADTGAITQYNIDYQQAMAQQSMNLQFTKNQIERYYDDMSEQQLEPLKNLEETLKIEKANIESRLDLIKNHEEAAKQMEKASAKDFTPEYTGGQG